MTIVVSWISNEREFPTLWTIADSRLSKTKETGEGPLLDCASKLFSIRVVCTKPDDSGYYFNDIYYSTKIGMSFAGSSLLGLNLYSFITSTLGSLGSGKDQIPSMQEIAEHVNAAFEALLNNYIEVNMNSIPCEISLFGYCPTENKHKLFHMKHKAEDKQILFNEFKFLGDSSIHLMGNHQDQILKSILSEREVILSSSGRGKDFWRSPKRTIEKIIERQIYPDIGGSAQLGINYPREFKLTPIYHPKIFENKFLGKHSPLLIHQGVNLYSNKSLANVGFCSVVLALDSIEKEE